MKIARHRMLRVPFALGCSLVGESHVRRDLPCQDAHRAKILPSRGVVIAVADGLGSASRSELGATTAVRVAAEHLTRVLDLKKADPRSAPILLLEAVEAARSGLETIAAAEMCSLRDLACTLLLVLADERGVASAHIGDGAAVGRFEDGLRVISPPGESRYVDEVEPLTSRDWRESLRVRDYAERPSAIAVFSDGVQRAALSSTPDGPRPFPGFFDPIFRFLGGLHRISEGRDELETFLGSRAMADHSDDDKTLVLTLLGRGPRTPI